jgi:hypothetical protein
MEKYNPQEKYFAYHLRHYYSLLNKRRGLQQDLVDLVNVGQRFDKHIKDIHLNLPELNWEIVNEVRNITYWELFNVSDNLKTRWGLLVDGHREFETDAELKPAAFSNKFQVGYPIVKDGTKPAHERAKEVARRLNLGKDYTVLESNYIGPFSPDIIEVNFPTIDSAVDLTKEYLLAYLDKVMEERRRKK